MSLGNSILTNMGSPAAPLQKAGRGMPREGSEPVQLARLVRQRGAEVGVCDGDHFARTLFR
jgi:hypothetical protein